MAKNQHKKQQKAMKKRRKDKARKEQSSGNSALSMLGLIKKANQFPIVECLINAGWDQDTGGLTRIVITRQQPDGLYVFASFIVDMLLLGVKDAHSVANVTTSQIREMLTFVYPDTSTEPCDVALAHQIIYQSIDYAAQYDMKPNKDFKRARNVLDERGTYPETHSLTFGKDGKPLFISGPFDNVDLILKKLERTAGPGNYDYIASVGSPFDDLLDDDIDDDLLE